MTADRLIPIVLRVEAAEQQRFAALVAHAQAAKADTPTVEAVRAAALAFAAGPGAHHPPGGMRFETVVANGVTCLWARPMANERAPIVYLHGGGYCAGSLQSHRGVAAFLADVCARPVFAIGYRQAPEHPFPAALEDAWQAYRWLARRTAPAAIVGESAGGALAIETAVRARDAGLAPGAAVAASPWFDLAMALPSWSANLGRDLITLEMGALFARAYLNGRMPEEANVLLADLHDLAPLLLIAGGAELGLDDALVMGKAAHAARVTVRVEIYDDLPHNFIRYVGPSASFAAARIASWIDSFA